MKTKGSTSTQRRKSKKEQSGNAKTVGRRKFLKAVPVMGAAGLMAANTPVAALAQSPGGASAPSPSPSPTPAALRITKEMLHQAEKLIGIEFTDAQESMALSGINRNLGAYETVRTKVAAVDGPMRGKGTLWVWFTDDSRRIPVQMKSKLGFATLVFELQSVGTERSN